MKIRKPMYYDEFKCIGSACQDTCCAGWEIEIDEETAECYHSVDGAIGKRLRDSITETEEEIYFNLQEGKRCPFLNQENLCDLIQECGEEFLCDICREHPRHYQWFGEYTEVGLGLCCEEAGRLLFRSPEKLEFICLEVSEEDRETEGDKTDSQSVPSEEEEEQAYIDLLLSARGTAYAIVQNREINLAERLILLLQYGEELQEAWDVEDFESVRFLVRVYQNQKAMASAWNKTQQIFCQQVREQVISEDDADTWEDRNWNKDVNISSLKNISRLLKLYENMESLDGSWQEQMKGLEQNIEELLQSQSRFQQEYPNAEYEYEHFTVYLLYRYFMEALFDGDILGKVKFVVVSYLVLLMMDLDTYQREAIFTLWSRIQNAKQYSKEIEYCTENMECFGKLCWQEECMSVESLTNVLRMCEGRKEE